jgi:hypothetical protein
MLRYLEQYSTPVLATRNTRKFQAYAPDTMQRDQHPLPATHYTLLHPIERPHRRLTLCAHKATMKAEGQALPCQTLPGCAKRPKAGTEGLTLLLIFLSMPYWVVCRRLGTPSLRLSPGSLDNTHQGTVQRTSPGRPVLDASVSLTHHLTVTTCTAACAVACAVHVQFTAQADPGVISAVMIWE